MKEIDGNQFVKLIVRKNKNSDFKPIVLFGDTGCGKSTVCGIVRKKYGHMLHESYALYHSNITSRKIKRILMGDICDKASQGLIQVFSATNIDVAKDFSDMFGLNSYCLSEDVGRNYRLIYNNC
tara:strand:- start:70 stop:441 length:372 start_codon:yes stop_codon:yes gene_type:complete